MWDCRLPFVIERQQETYWCWAATAVSTARYLLSATRSQCDVANAVLARTDCCGAGGAGPCNVTRSLRPALQAVSTYARTEPRPLTPAELRAELTAGRPVATRVEWPDGGGHFTVIAGIASDDELEIADPWYGTSVEPYDRYAHDYQQLGGRWTHSYLLAGRDDGGGALTLERPFAVFRQGAIVSVVDVSVYSARVDELAVMGLLPRLTGSETLPGDGDDLVRGRAESDGVAPLRAPSYADSLRRTLSGLRSAGRPVSGLRLLKIPSMYVTAVWLHSPGQDVFLPLEPAPRYLEAGHEYPLPHFEELLREHARSRMDDMARERASAYDADAGGSAGDEGG